MTTKAVRFLQVALWILRQIEKLESGDPGVAEEARVLVRSFGDTRLSQFVATDTPEWLVVLDELAAKAGDLLYPHGNLPARSADEPPK